jgi:tRNA (mo5U34)-methyltransferase
LSFIEHRVAGDRTNWWAPNPAALEAMLRSTGLRVVARPLEEFYVCVPDPELPSSMWSWNASEYFAAVSAPNHSP